MSTIVKYEAAVADLPISGIQPMTTIDFPGRIAAVLFTPGCPWACRYCHNPALRNCDGAELVPHEKVSAFLRDRRLFLDGIVMSGGEPTMHRGLTNFMAHLRELGYDTGIHTNGYEPNVLKHLLRKHLLDFVALDIKAPPVAYDRITERPGSGAAVGRSLKEVLGSGVAYECRTTYHPDLLSEDELRDTMHAVHNAGVRTYHIQRFRDNGVEDTSLLLNGRTVKIPSEIVAEGNEIFDVFSVR